jgi:poly(3-hydroxybutyrate) depolymerase
MVVFSGILIVRLSLLILVSGAAGIAYSQQSVSGPEDLVYKTVADTNLIAHVFRPSGTSTSQPRPAIVLFHGGGWPSAPQTGSMTPRSDMPPSGPSPLRLNIASLTRTSSSPR